MIIVAASMFHFSIFHASLIHLTKSDVCFRSTYIYRDIISECNFPFKNTFFPENDRANVMFLH